MAVTYVSNQENGTAGTSPQTISVNIGTRTNGLLVVGISFYASDTVASCSMTYGGISLSQAVSHQRVAPVYINTRIFYLANPPNDTNNLVITWSITGDGSLTNKYTLASWYDGANQTQASVLDQINSGIGDTDPSLDITPSENNELIVSHYHSESGSFLAVGADETLINNVDFGLRVSGGSYAIQTTATSQTINWTGSDDYWTMVVASFKQAAAGGTAHEKGLSDSISFAEATAKRITKPAIADSQSPAEALANTIVKTLADACSLAEGVANKSSLSVSDSITFAEDLSTENEFHRSLSDTLSTDESIVKGISAVLADTLTPSEELAKSITLVLADSVTFDDALTTTNEFYRSLEDTVTFADAEVGEISLSLADEIVLTDQSPADYLSYALITIDNTKVSGSANLENFPVLISGTYDGTDGEPDLRTSANGGDVQNTASGGASGSYTVPADLVFSASTDGSSPYDHEIEKYDATTGEIIAWVKIPTLDYDDDTTLYMVYNNSAVTTSQEDVAGTWDDNYDGVWHLAQAPTNTTEDSSGGTIDSTSYSGSMDSNDSVAAAVGLGLAFDGNDAVNFGNVLSKEYNNSFSIGCWVNTSSSNPCTLISKLDKDSPSSDAYRGYRINSAAGACEFQVISNWGGNNGLGVKTNATYNDGDWHYFKVTYDGTSHNASGTKIYVDGVEITERTISKDTLSQTIENSAQFSIGSTETNFQYLTGSLDEARVENRICTAGWIATEYNNQSSPSTFYAMGSATLAPGVDNTEKETTKTLADAITFDDSLVAKTTTELILTDELPVAESVANKSTLGLSDSHSIVEGLVIVNEFHKSLGDNLALIEAQAGVTETKHVLEDSVAIAEGIANGGSVNVSDSQSITENLDKAVEYHLSISDILALTDSEVELAAISLSDSISIEDSPIESFVVTAIAIDDSLSISESLTELGIGKPLIDSLSISELLAKNIYVVLSDAINIADAEVEYVKFVLGDSISISEALANQITLGISDSISFSDDFDREVEFYLSLSDEITFDDGTGKEIVTSLTDSISIVESVSLEPQPNLSDSVAFSEDITLASNVGLSDSQSVVESVVFGVGLKTTANIFIEGILSRFSIKKGLADAVSFADGLVPFVLLKFDFEESVSFSESLVSDVVKNNTETFGLFDEVSIAFTKPLSDSIEISDSAVTTRRIFLSDSLTIADSEVGVISLEPTDSVDISESSIVLVTKFLSESVSIAESEQKAITSPKTEIVSVSEAVGNSATLAHSDLISINEATATVIEFYRSLTETISFSEDVGKDFYKILSDSVEFSDTQVEKQIIHLEDSVTPIDESQVKTIVKGLSDSETLSDSEVVGFSVPLSDSLSITEAAVTLVEFKRSTSDSVAFSEEPVFTEALFKTETEAVTESLANSYVLNLSDAITIVESQIGVQGIDLSDLINISEAIDKVEITKVLSDNVAVADSFVEGVQFHIAFSETLNLDESLSNGIAKDFTESVSITELLEYMPGIDLSDTLDIAEGLERVADYHLEFSETIAISESEGASWYQVLGDATSFSEALVKYYVIQNTEGVTLLEAMVTDKQPQQRIGQIGFLRTRYM